MARNWQVVSLEDAKQHPLYGIQGWLALFALGLLLGLGKEFGVLSGEAQKAGMTIGQLLALAHPASTYMQIALVMEVAIVAIIYWLLFTKHPKFRLAASVLLLCSWPALALIGVANSFPGLGNALAMAFFQWLISCAVWVTYLQRSKRVRVTFEHAVLAESSDAEVLAETSNAAASFQHRTSQPQATVSNSRTAVMQTARSSEGLEEMKNTSPTDDNASYAVAAEEIEKGNIDRGLWARLFADADGDEQKTKARYIKHRASQLNAKRGNTSSPRDSSDEPEFASKAEITGSPQFRAAVSATLDFSLSQLRDFVMRDPTLPLQTDDRGRTLLLFAASIGALPIVDFLIEKGSVPTHKDKEGRSAMDVLQSNSQILDFVRNDITAALVRRPSAPKGRCPNCNALIALASIECPNCPEVFVGRLATRHIIPISYGKCPTCNKVIDIQLSQCPDCKTSFSASSAWKVIPL